MCPETGDILVPEFGRAAMTDWSRRQVANLVGLKWDRWFEGADSATRATEMNARFARADDRVKLRTRRVIDSDTGPTTELRALVSPGYVPVSDAELAWGIADALERHDPEATLIRHAATDRSLSFVVKVGRAFVPGRTETEVGECWGSLFVMNSGVGYCSVRILSYLVRLLCKNGMTAPLKDPVLLRSAHRGNVQSKIAKGVTESLPRLAEDLHVAYRRLAASLAVRVGSAGEAIADFLRLAKLPLKLAPRIVEAYQAEPNPSAFGIAQAVTRAAQSLSPEERFLLERAAGQYLSNLN
ncbi:MAG: DUF932 domain-containing protein [Polyangiaceae bacterium]|nr:DUF932 domain-containing protein [Polyangiaceae bacterium]